MNRTITGYLRRDRELSRAFVIEFESVGETLSEGCWGRFKGMYALGIMG